MSDTAEIVLAEMPKNAAETIRILATEFNGHELADIRVWAKQGTTPTKKGLVIRRAQIPGLIEALRAAQNRAEEL